MSRDSDGSLAFFIFQSDGGARENQELRGLRADGLPHGEAQLLGGKEVGQLLEAEVILGGVALDLDELRLAEGREREERLEEGLDAVEVEGSAPSRPAAGRQRKEGLLRK